MFGMGIPEFIVILVVALLVVGPKKLPELAKSLGKGVMEFRRATENIKNELVEDNTYKEFKEVSSMVKDTVMTMNRESFNGENILKPKKPKESIKRRQNLKGNFMDDDQSDDKKSPV